MTTTLELHDAGPLCRIRFRSPNGVQILRTALLEELSGALSKLAKRADVRVVVFEAEGRTFLAGADLQELKALNPVTAYHFARVGQRLMQQVADLPAVTIAAIHAACAGGGCELALACDLRIAGASARIGLPETSLGVLPGWGGTVRAVRRLSASAARRAILSADLFPADEALRLGLVDEVHPDDQLANAVNERAAHWQSRGPRALRSVKSLIRRFERSGSKKQFRREARQFAACFQTGEPAEGIAAFLEKRPPKWPFA